MANVVSIDGYRRFSSGRSTSQGSDTIPSSESTDCVGTPEVISAISGAITALADTLNALGLRIALAKNQSGSGADISAGYYNRLSRLAESAAGQVRGIQQLLATIEESELGRTRNRSRS